MLTLWGFIAPLVERLRPAAAQSKPVAQAKPAKRVQASKQVKKRKPTDPGKSSPVAADRDVAALQPTLFEKPARRIAPRAPSASVTLESAAPRPVRVPMQERYDALVKEMLQTYNVRVRKWRTSMSGVAWYIEYRDGTTVRLLESPKPKSPMSLAIFLHEIGHHAIGLGIHKPRCLEELLAWNYAITTMQARGFDVTDRVKKRMDRSLRYAVRKALRRGLRTLPAELEPYR